MLDWCIKRNTEMAKEIEDLDDRFHDLRAMVNELNLSQVPEWSDADIAMDTMLYRLECSNREQTSRLRNDRAEMSKAIDTLIAKGFE